MCTHRSAGQAPCLLDLRWCQPGRTDLRDAVIRIAASSTTSINFYNLRVLTYSIWPHMLGAVSIERKSMLSLAAIEIIAAGLTIGIRLVLQSRAEMSVDAAATISADELLQLSLIHI